MATNTANGMSRLQALWEWQKQKKEKEQKGKVQESLSSDKHVNKPQVSTKSRAVPRYMLPTESVKQRKNNISSIGVTSKHNISNNSFNKSSISQIAVSKASEGSLKSLRTIDNKSLTSKGSVAKENNQNSTRQTSKRQALVPSQTCNTKRETVKKKDICQDKRNVGISKIPVLHNKTSPKVTGKRKFSPEECPNTEEDSLRRSSKRRRKADSVSHDVLDEASQVETDVKLMTEADVNGLNQKNPTASNKPRASIAPEGTLFTFSKKIDDIGLAQFNKGDKMDTIAEDDSPISEPTDSKITQIIKTPMPNIQLTADDNMSAKKTAQSSKADRKTTPRCRYETLHNVKQQKLSERLRNATSCEDKLMVLSESPMIEMSRRKRAVTIFSPVVKLSLEDAEEKDNQSSSQVTSIPATEDASVPPVKDVSYFKRLVQEYTEKLEGLARNWDSVNESLTDSTSEEVQGEIRTTSCQARLIIAERFDQFSGLINQCEYKTGDKPVLAEDLDGFWEMIFFQVQDVLNKFENLQKLKANNWISEADSEKKESKIKKQHIKKKNTQPVKAKGPSKFAAFKAGLKNKQQNEEGARAQGSSDLMEVEFIGGGEINGQSSSDIVLENASKDMTSPDSSQKTEISERTYSFRRSTVEATLDLRKLPVTPCLSSKKVSRRSQSVKKSARRSRCLDVPHSAASPDLAMYLPMEDTLSSKKPKLESKALQAVMSAVTTRDSPDLTSYLGESASRPSSRIEMVKYTAKACSPSPIMVRAMLSASQSGKKGTNNTPLKAELKSTHCESLAKIALKSAARRLVGTEPSGTDSVTSSPINKLVSLNLDESLTDKVDDMPILSPLTSPEACVNMCGVIKSNGNTPMTDSTYQDRELALLHKKGGRSLRKSLLRSSTKPANVDVVNDLVVFSPMPSTPEPVDELPIITPRRSARKATKRISLL